MLEKDLAAVRLPDLGHQVRELGHGEVVGHRAQNQPVEDLCLGEVILLLQRFEKGLEALTGSVEDIFGKNYLA